MREKAGPKAHIQRPEPSLNSYVRANLALQTKVTAVKTGFAAFDGVASSIKSLCRPDS